MAQAFSGIASAGVSQVESVAGSSQRRGYQAGASANPQLTQVNAVAPPTPSGFSSTAPKSRRLCCNFLQEMSSEDATLKVSSIIDPTSKAYPEQFRRVAEALNSKAHSCLSAYLSVIGLTKQLVRFQVPAGQTLKVFSASATAQTAGAGGTVGLTLRMSGGIRADGTAVTQDFAILPATAVTTDLTQATLLSYEVPGGNTFIITQQSEDYGAGTEPTGINVFLDVLLV